MIAQPSSTHAKSDTFETDLHKMYPKIWLMQLAKKTKFIKRERKIKSEIIFWSLALGFSDRSQRTIAGFKRLYEKEANTSLSDSSWYDRFTPEFVEFLHKCVIHGIEELEKEPGRKLSEKLRKFKDILIQDSTIVRLHDSLANKFPATRARKIAAGIKVGVMISAIANGPKTVALYPENTAEIKTLRIGPWIKDRILLVDLGFYKTQLFARVEANGGYFVSRIRKNMDPFIVSIESGILEKKREEFIGKRVSELTEQLSGKDLDAVVKIAFKRRAYKGKQRKDEMYVRLVATYNCTEEKYHIYITNILKDVLDVNDIAKLYGARWEIELLFKELKSGYALDELDTKNVQIISAFIWTSILTLIVSRRLHNFVKNSLVDAEKKVRYTQLLWSKIFTSNILDLLKLLLKNCEVKRVSETLMRVYISQGLDPHVNRKRFRAQWVE